MSESTLDPLEQRLAFGAVVAAVASIPIVVMQMSSNHQVHTLGELFGVAVWLFFSTESLVMFSRSTERGAWIRSHVLELAVVIGTAPIYLVVTPTLIGGGPIVGLIGLLRAGRVVRLLKCAKLAKAGRIVDRDEAFSNHSIDLFISVIVIVIFAGVMGTVVDEERHSIVSGFRYWLPKDGTYGSLFPSVVVLVVLLITLAIHKSHNRKI